MQLNASVLSQHVISLKLENASLKECINEIEASSGLGFLYNGTELKEVKGISIDVMNSSVEEILNSILSENGFEYLIQDDVILITKTTPEIIKSVLVQAIEIKGKITDSKGNPLSGATIVEKGTTNGITTDINGNYVLEVSGVNSIIRISYIGFETQDIIVGSKTLINIVLESSASKLDEVVIIGYGAVKKRDLTGSVAKFDSEILKESASSDLGQMLQGQISGLTILTGNGSPGEPVKLQIRGVPSLVGSIDPLIVVDDVEMPEDYTIDELNTSDIKSVSILKGASSTAIYGSRAAGGVILITTKKGNYNSRPTINYEFSHGNEYLVSTIRSLTTEEFKLLYFEALRNTARERGYNDITKYSVYKNAIAPGFFGEEDVNWMSHLTQSAFKESHKLSLRGGSKTARYYTSIGYTNQKGLVIGTGARKINLTMNLDLTINRWMKANVRLRQSMMKRDVNYRGLEYTLTSRPDIKALNDDGTPYTHTFMQYGRLKTIYNPIVEIGAFMYHNKDKATNFSAGFDFTILPELKLKTTFSYNRRTGDRRRYAPSNSSISNTWTGTVAGELTTVSSENESTKSEAHLTYIKQFNKDHLFDAVLVGSYSESSFTGYTLAFTDFPDDKVQNAIWQATNWKRSYGYAKGSALISFVGRLNYKYKKKYLLTASWRKDGSSRLSPKSRWGVFPSVALGWIISDEDFMKDVSWIYNLKLRSSWGKTGMGYVPEYSWRTLYQATSYNNNPSVIPKQIGNDELHWESTTQYDLAIDFSLTKKGSINGTLNFYLKNTDGLLFPKVLAPSTGYGSTMINLAGTQNKGVEFDIDARIINKKDLKCSVNFNIGKNINKITNIGPEYISTVAPGYVYLNNSVISEGEPLGLIYGFKTDGIWQSQEEIDKYEALNPDHKYQNDGSNKILAPGDVKYVDINGDGWVNTKYGINEDKTILGNSRPDYEGGFGTRIIYKNFTFALQGTFSHGAKKYWRAVGLQFRFNSRTPKNLMDVALKRWTPENPTNEYPSLKMGGSDYNFNDFYVYDASYIKIQNINITYKIPESLLKRMKYFSSISIYASCNNVFTFTSYPGPSVESYSRNAIQGSFTDYGKYPKTKVFNFGVKCVIK
jgi:TonB-linked SusC/RagA family outer membrane protein